MNAIDDCPQLGDWVERHNETCRGGRRLSLLVNRRDGRAIQLSAAEVAVCDLMDGTRSPHDLTGDEATGDLLAALDEGGFLRDSVRSDRRGRGDSVPRRVGAFLATLDLEWRSADQFVAWSYRRGLRHAFRPLLVVGQVALGAIGTVAVAAAFLSDEPLQIRAAPSAIPVVLMMGLVAVAIHEMAHALVVTHYGRSIRSIGFRLHLGTPAFYVDSVEAMLLSRRQRIIQAGAGPWAEWLVTSLAALALWLGPTTSLTPLLHRFVVLNTVVVASNLLPFVGLDGHWLLADTLREPDLARRCQGSIGRVALGISTRRRVRREDVALAIYSVANTVVAAALVLIAFFFWWELFGELIAGLVRGGPVGWSIVALAMVLLGRPAVAAVGPRAERAWNTMRRLADRARFRAQRSWRVRATEQLATHPALAGLEHRSLGVVAGLLGGGRTIRNAVRLDAGFSGLAVVGPHRFQSWKPVSVLAVDDTGSAPRIRCDRGGFVALIDHRTLSAVLPTHVGVMPAGACRSCNGPHPPFAGERG